MRVFLTFLLMVFTAGLAAAASPPDDFAAPTARITAVIGGATSDSGALEQRAEIADGQKIETADDGNCAVLLEEDALIELCGGTTLTLARAKDTGRRVINVEAGEARIVVDPLAGERIEIHTPAAIATIMGTIVYVTVDKETGVTTITSSDHEVEIRSNDSAVAGSTTITGGESTTIEPGRAPAQKQQLSRRHLANLGGCLVDLHEVSINIDRGAAEAKVTEKVAAGDMNSVDLPGVGGGPPILALSGSGDELTDETDVIDPIDTFDPPIFGPLPDCGPLPGEHCGF